MFARDCGVPRLDRESFVETFLYRFIKNVDHSREYDIYFYDINEVPPKVSVLVNSATVLAFNVKDADNQQAQITTSYDAIAVSNFKNNLTVEEHLGDPNSDACKMYYNVKIS